MEMINGAEMIYHHVKYAAHVAKEMGDEPRRACIDKLKTIGIERWIG